MVDQLNEKFPGKLVDILMLCKSHQCGMLTLYAVCQFRPFSVQPGQYIRKSDGLSFIIGFDAFIEYARSAFAKIKLSCARFL